MLEELLLEQKTLVNRYFDALDVNQADLVLEELLACKGTIFFSGVGKSGLIAQKIVATLVSIGTSARFLSPLDALHGDIGIIGSNDLFVAMSKSGETEELLSLLPFMEKRQVKTIGLVSRKGSRLEKKAFLSVFLPVEKELCPHDLTPTISSTVQLLFGDALAAAFIRAKKVTLSQFAANHPGGLIGRKITLKVADLMLKGASLPVCNRSDKLVDVLHELSSKRCGCLLVIEEDSALGGIFTDGDLSRAIGKFGSKALERPIEELMTKSARTIDANVLAIDAMETMEKDKNRPVTVLPVVQEGKLVGLIRLHDILQLGLK